MSPAAIANESESDDVDTIPSKPVKNNGKEKEVVEVPSEGSVSGDNEEDSDEDGETFAVEKILEHQISRGAVLYHVKWLGYEAEEDLTWEPAENLQEGAGDILDEYHASIGGKPDPKAKASKKRKSAADSPAAGARGRATKKTKSNGWVAPVGSWEDHIESIETVSDEPTSSGELCLHVFMKFADGYKTKYPMKLVRQKCPQRLLDYYEKHLVFKDGSTAGGADTGMQDA